MFFNDLTVFLIATYFAHWLGDFILQSDAIAKGKSKSVSVLLQHVFIYFGVLGIYIGFASMAFAALRGTGFCLGTMLSWLWINVACHLVTDYFTSKASSRLYTAGRNHDFFCMIGFDQFLHMVVLTSTTIYLYSNV